MIGTSAYVQISNFALLEYEYLSQSISTLNAKCLRLENNYTNTYQFLNNSEAVNVTGNVLDRSASRMGKTSTIWAYHDIDTAIPIIQIDANFKLVDVTSSLLSTQKYDKVKLHIVSGFDFNGLDGIILDLQWKEWAFDSNNKTFSSATQAYIKGDSFINFNSRPIFVGDRYYDRYIEFYVPSLFDVNQDFWNSPTATNTIGYQYTYNNVGFLQTSQIFASLYEISNIVTTNGNKYLTTGRVYESVFNTSDLYSFVGASLKENTEFDYIEYYPTYHGGFIEEYINNLNSIGGDWVIINQIEVFEQVGISLIRTANMTMLQDSNFDAPGIFRPIILNSAFAFSYTIEYTMRLFNKVDGSEVIRKSTFTSLEPKKYGRELQKINVLKGFQPVKVYNKIVRNDEENLKTALNTVNNLIYKTQNVYISNFYDMNMISVDSTSDVSNVIGEIVWPQGLNTIFLNKFDNFVKFKIFTKSKDKKQNVAMNLASGSDIIKLAFILDDNSKIYIEQVIDLGTANPSAGEILFKIDDSISTKLLSGLSKEYFLINQTPEGDEVLVYHGTFEDQKNKEVVLKENLEKMVSTIEDRLAKIKNTTIKKTTDVTNKTLNLESTKTEKSPVKSDLETTQKSEISSTTNSTKIIISSANSLQNAITKASEKNGLSKRNIQIVEQPGVTPSLGDSPTKAFTPSVANPSDPTTSLKFEDVSKSNSKK